MNKRNFDDLPSTENKTDSTEKHEKPEVESVAIPVEAELVKIGIVKAPMLNVREKPIPTSNPIMIINCNDEVVIDPKFVSSEWYKVRINNVDGYVMKKFIAE